MRIRLWPHETQRIVHLINQPPLLHETTETCICRAGACSYTQLTVINRARSSENGPCSLDWLLCREWTHAEHMATPMLVTASTQQKKSHGEGWNQKTLFVKTISICGACWEAYVTEWIKFVMLRPLIFCSCHHQRAWYFYINLQEGIFTCNSRKSTGLYQIMFCIVMRPYASEPGPGCTIPEPGISFHAVIRQIN